MFSAHIVFGDINNHSNIPYDKRVEILNKYWEICEKYRPSDLNEYSFYETDNDALMAGFSSQNGFISGYDVINHIVCLNKKFEENNITVSYGINLMACTHDIEWKTYRGFVNDIQMIHMPDELFKKIGAIQRSRLAGDALIATARLQSLAKKLGVMACISIFNNGHINQLNNYELDNGEIIKSKEVTNEFHRLGKEQEKWLTDRHIKAYTLEIEKRRRTTASTSYDETSVNIKNKDRDGRS